MTRRAALAAAALALAGCCAGPEYRATAGDAALRIDEARTFALVATVLDDPERWAYGAPAAALAPLARAYRPPGAGEAIADPGSAPAPLRGALAAARAALEELGFVLAGGAEADLVVRVGVTLDAGRVQRVSLDVGGVVDGTFAPGRVGLEARLPRGGCETSAAEVTAALAGALPRSRRGAPGRAP